MAWLKSVFGLAVGGGCAMVAHAAGSAPAPSSVEGRWGGAQAQLVIDASGGRLETDCASGTLVGPLSLSGQGRFQTSGTFAQHQPGPQRADDPAAPDSAQYSGEVKDGVMRLSVTPEGGRAVQQFQLRKGQGGKLLRCL
jgi:hypothetical protein